MSAVLDPHDPRVRVVTAPAGSGKTRLLLYHYLRFLQGSAVDGIVAITFTRKAASELVERLSAILRAVRSPKETSSADWARLQELYGPVLPTSEKAHDALAALDSAPVCTVDAFTLSLVQEFLLDAGLPLSDGRQAPVDFPVTSGASAASHHEAAAREVLEKFGAEAQVVLRELTLGEAIRAVARVSEAGRPSVWTLDQVEPLDRLGLSPALVEAWASEDVARKREVFEDPAVRARTEAFRQAIVTLADQARDRARETIAADGALGYEELLAAATSLCRAKPSRLVQRFDALLVDELQDTNPSQLEFYEAFAGMKGDGPGRMGAFFVGDARQSIFRFRQANPHGWRRLVEGAQRSGEVAELKTNFRSSKLLVGAQKALVDCLHAQGATGVDLLHDLAAREDSAEGAIEDSWKAPILWVDEPDGNGMDGKVLTLFARRLEERWKAAPGESAAVLTRTWETATWAKGLLEARGIRAQLTGEKSITSGRVAVDLRILLRALHDTADEIAVAALLKHPSIGLDDRALMLIRAEAGFGKVFAPDFAPKGIDVDAWGTVGARLGVLREARKELGRASTADVLESVVSRLHWRPIIHAGPEGEGGVGLAQLDVILDAIRTAEADQVDPAGVVELLDPEAQATEFPLVRLGDGEGVVTVTTVFAAKGLEFDHVALLETHKKARCADTEGKSAVVLGRPGGVSMLGVLLDPDGAFERKPDPLALLARKGDALEDREEGLRLFYVGFTRAKQSVALGTGKERADNLAGSLRGALAGVSQMDSLRACIMRFPGSEVEVAEPGRPVRSRTLRNGNFASQWSAAVGQVQARPSDAKEHLEARDLAARLLAEAEVVEGRPAPGLPAVAGYEAIPDIIWGDVVHGWLERWGMKGSPEVAVATRYLTERWSTSEPEFARWLCDTGLAIRDGLPGFGKLLGEASKVHFELPLVGIEEGLIWTGRSDLILEFPGLEAVVVDFKAGSRVALSGEIPGAESYAAQLDAYRRILELAGYKVREVGLIYARGVSWVRWRTGDSAVW